MPVSALLSQQERAQPLVAQEQPAPDQRAHDRWEGEREGRRADTRLGCERTAEIAGQQNGAQRRGARDDVDRQADKLKQAEANDQAGRVAKQRGRFDSGREAENLDDRRWYNWEAVGALARFQGWSCGPPLAPPTD